MEAHAAFIQGIRADMLQKDLTHIEERMEFLLIGKEGDAAHFFIIDFFRGIHLQTDLLLEEVIDATIDAASLAGIQVEGFSHCLE